MAAIKTKSISRTDGILLKRTKANGPLLAALENVMMREREARDCLDIPNSDIINDAILIAYKIKCRRKK